MVINLSISEARKKLSAMLKEIQKDPSKIYHISINEIVIGELRYPVKKHSRDKKLSYCDIVSYLVATKILKVSPALPLMMILDV